MPSSHHHGHHPHHTEYAPPVIHPPSSPTSSIGTAYDQDQTSFSDSEEQLSQFQFEKKCVEMLGLNRPKVEEELATMVDPLLPKTLDEEERQVLFEHIMKNLRYQVEKIEENELYEQRLFQGSQIGLEPMPSTNDIDGILKSMMGPSSSSLSGAGHPGATAMTTTMDMAVDSGMTGTLPTTATSSNGHGQGARPTITSGPWNMPRDEVKQFPKFVNGQRKQIRKQGTPAIPGGGMG